MGLRPLVCSAKSWYYTTVPVLNIRRRCAKNKPAYTDVEELARSGKRLDSIHVDEVDRRIQRARHPHPLPLIFLHLLLIIQFVWRGLRHLQHEALRFFTDRSGKSLRCLCLAWRRALRLSRRWRLRGCGILSWLGFRVRIRCGLLMRRLLLRRLRLLHEGPRN